MSLGDTLVLRITENNATEKIIIYTFYDIEKNLFEIRGQRIKPNLEVIDFSYKTKYKKVLADFIKLFFVETNNYEFDILNASNLSVDSKFILFENIQEYDKNVIIGFHYDCRKKMEDVDVDLTKFLNMIQHFQNDDYLFGDKTKNNEDTSKPSKWGDESW